MGLGLGLGLEFGLGLGLGARSRAVPAWEALARPMRPMDAVSEQLLVLQRAKRGIRVGLDTSWLRRIR